MESASLFRVVGLDNESYVFVEERGFFTAYTVQVSDAPQQNLVVETKHNYVVVKLPDQSPVQLEYGHLYHLDSICRALFGSKEIFSSEKKVMTLPPNCT